MKNILLPILFICLFLISSCSSNNAESWNESLIESYNKAVDEIEDFEELISLETIGDTVVNQQLLVLGNNILSHLDKSLNGLAADGEVPSGAKDCQMAAIDMLESMQKQVAYGLEYINFSSEAGETEVDDFADEYDKISSETATKVNAFVAVHTTFKKKVLSEE